MADTVTLYRPVGKNELQLIEASGFTSFPPRLPEQPIFYPVTNRRYAEQIARDWNANLNADRAGYVTKFDISKEYLDRFERKVVGGSEHEEYWIPADDLPEFNANIIGTIAVIAEFYGDQNK